MLENLSSGPNEQTEIREKFRTAEYDKCRPFLYKLSLLSKDELETTWNKIYLDEYIKNDDYRRNGEHDLALQGYRKLQALLDVVKKSGIESEDVLGREAVCHYQVIQCYCNLQSETDSIKRELYLYTEVLVEMLKNALKGHPDSADFLLKIDEILNAKKQMTYEEVFKILTDFWDKSKGKMNTENLGWIWKLAYFINRYCTISHDFYMLCTPHVKEADKLIGNSKDSGRFAQKILTLLPDEYIKRSNSHRVFAQQTRKWLSFYPDILSAYRNVLIGGSIDTTIDFSQDIRDYLENSVDNYVNKKGSCEQEYVQDFEHNVELLALCYFAEAYTYPEKYKQEVNNLGKLSSIAEKYKLHRILQIIEVYKARLALRNGDQKDINDAIKRGKDLRKRNKRVNTSAEHITDKWLNVLEAENLLIEHKVQQQAKNRQKHTHDKVAEKVKIAGVKKSECNPRNHLESIEKIEELFKGYTDPKLKIRLKRGVFLPLEAQTYYLLGMANVEKARVIGENLPNDKDSDLGKDLLDAFEKARNFLCEAYSILKQMDYGDELLDKIADEYIQMVRLNYKLSGLTEEQIQERIPQRKDMDKIVKNFEMQKWVEIVFEAIKTNKIDPQSNYTKQIAESVKNGIQHIIPEVRNLFIVNKKGEEWDLSQFKDDEQRDMARHVLVNSSENPSAEFDFYYLKHGHIMLCIELDNNENRKMIFELDISLNTHAKEIVKDIKNIIRKFLEHFDLRKALNNSQNNDYKEKKIEVLKSASEIFKILFSIHPPTITHSSDLADMLLISAQEMKSKDPSSNLDEVEIYYAGLLHDIGKLGLDPFLILDKATKLLPYERDRVEKHALDTVKVLRGLLGFKDFKNIIALCLAHHILYGVERGYPFDAIGDEIKNILSKLCQYLMQEDDQIDEQTGEAKNSLTQEEQRFLLSEEALLTQPYCNLARDIVMLDQLQAIRALDRNYRNPIPLDQFEGYILSRIGRDYDPKRALRIIDLIKSGKYSTFIARHPGDVKILSNLKTTFLLEWDDLFKFLLEYQNSLEETCGIPYDAMIVYFKKGVERNLQIGYSALRAGFCQIFIDNERQNGLQEDDAREAGKKKFFPLENRIFEFVHEYLEVAA